MASIEIYNKPVFQYRDECVVILLLNAWELLLKAILSKHGAPIYYPKQRNQPYRTLSWHDALVQAMRFIERDIESLPLRLNLELLGTYRDNSVHFYNAKGFSVVMYSLAQTSIKNFRDLQESVFGERLEEKMSWQLLPLGINPPIDVVSYISGKSSRLPKQSNAVRQFLSVLAESSLQVKTKGYDTGRLFTVFSVMLQSVKKIGDADVVVGIDRSSGESGPLTIVRTQDPNISHPLLKKDIVKQIPVLQGNRFTSFTFQAIVWRHQLKENPQYCWRAKEGVLTKYSNDVLAYIRRLTRAELERALADYRLHTRPKTRRQKPFGAS